ncbi:hypothetical protein Tco_0858635 [Tanacetum coccineum]|uniref:Uncharacterized protein n=1 Tax=Tanacetum coccineum TaxID=301880 RepID=A0ABQ5BCM7_9ASTR
MERQVNKEVDEGYEHLKVKLKAKQQPLPEAQLLLNLKKQGKESNKQTILEEIKRKNRGEGSGAAPEAPDYSSSSDDSSQYANDDKTESVRDSDHDKSDTDYEKGDESDKSAFDEESAKSDESDKDSDNADDQTNAYVINPYDKVPEQPPKEFPTLSPSVTTTSVEDYTRYLNDSKDVQMSELLNKPLYTEATTMTVSLILETIHETQE